MSFAVPTPGPSGPGAEHYSRSADRLSRSTLLRDGNVVTTHERSSQTSTDPADAFHDAWLRRSSRVESTASPLTVADLFSGCGGMSVGAHEAARAVGRHARHVLAVDNNEQALAVFGNNFPEAELHSAGIETLLDGELGDRPTRRERALRDRFAGLDLALGGPPCQGNSDLNNHTRRADPRNALYLRMARFAEVVRPRLLVVENVPGVAHDRSGVVPRTQRTLEDLGYSVDTGLLAATSVGAAQQRRRHVLLASRESDIQPDVAGVTQLFGRPARSVWDVIRDLGVTGDDAFDTAASHRPVNVARIAYLFAHDLYELPDHQRPDCHRLKPHSYRSVYGRMRPDQPAPTITSGFGSTGQGRFVHPHQQRTLTPHEAARVQGFPDWFSFAAAPGRRALQEMIGNAVPSQLAYAAIASLLR
jgi:DNA (cytosine-5)-methyltransferase 1